MFTLFGFRVHVQSGFVVFMLLLVALNGSEFGLWLAASIAAFTLIHELGHAWVARANDAHAEISLGFLAGYASYVPTRPLTRLQRAAISFAGPGIHITLSTLALLALGANPFDVDAVRDSPITLAVWWAGPVIGALNLIPVLPLDGGHIVMHGLDFFIGRRAMKVMIYASIAITLGVTVAAFLSPRYRVFAVFIAFLLITQFQLLAAIKPKIDPWHEAEQALDAGKPGKARRTLTAALSSPGASRLPTPTQSTATLQQLLATLPEPLPFGNPANEQVLAEVLIRAGRFEDAAHYAAASFERRPNSLSAATIARASAALDDRSTALGWLRAAADLNTAPEALAIIIDRAPELNGLRLHPDVVALRSAL